MSADASRRALPKHVPVPADRTAEIANGAIDMFIERLWARGCSIGMPPGESIEHVKAEAIIEVIEGENARAEIPQPEDGA